MTPTHRFRSLTAPLRRDDLTYLEDPYAEICIEAPQRGEDPLVAPSRRSETGLAWWRQLGDTAKICLAAGIGALAIAAIGAVVNLFVGSWFQATGMAMVGLFYLILFATNLPPRGVSTLGAAELMRPESK